ncbi:MAG: AmmeMemoRadiSam system protein B [Bacteroidetes bacterium]|jgi:AmmeMemoRadiSam system protein B/AmmeMemoRadiSam system protein A|nr:AmmeMemoRadiSam system protein B [Bacteroidota bacterium]
MKRTSYCIAFLLLVVSCSGEKINPNNSQPQSTRPAAFAGTFYPADSTMLANAITAFVKDASPIVATDPVAIIVPHAGYVFSGQIAADGYNQVRHTAYDLVVIIGTNHSVSNLAGIVVYPKGAFATPIGAAEIDEKAADELMKEDRDAAANVPAHAKEHSVEVQVPFIKYLFPHARILPVIIGEPDVDLCIRFGHALAKVLKNKEALIVASSDLSHYPGFDDAVRTDNRTLKTICSMDPEEISRSLSQQVGRNVPGLLTCACGEGPIIAAVAAAKDLGANSTSIVGYSNSGYNPLGTADRVVGYGAVVFGKGKASAPDDVDSLVVNSDYRLDSSDKRTLLGYARKTLEQYFTSQTVPLPRHFNPFLKVKRGAFVTLRKNGELRGCIGHMDEDRPLSTVVGAMALQAAFNDPRFRSLSADELRQIEIEISVLTPIAKVGSAADIVLGRDGVVLKKGDKQAVFLPQVAKETGWSREVFLDQLCYKAGLNAGDWKKADLFTFQADVFSEAEIH